MFRVETSRPSTDEKQEAVLFSKKLVHICQTVRRHIPEEVGFPYLSVKQTLMFYPIGEKNICFDL
jgi:hypothetical protein